MKASDQFVGAVALQVVPPQSVRQCLWNRLLVRHALIAVVATLLVISRRPDAILYPQFWAEDGVVWYANAYHLGPWQALLLPEAGYFQTLSRLVAALGLLVPLRWTPLLFNLVAIALQVLPVNLLCSSRFAALMPSAGARLTLAVGYLALPNFETHANLTNAQWHLALLACMIVLAQPATTPAWRAFDVSVVALASVSGPLSIMLAPIALVRWYFRHHSWLLVLGGLLSTGALLQLGALVFSTHAPRPSEHTPLGATPALFARIVGGQVFLGTLLGSDGYAWLSASALWNGLFAGLTTAIGLLVTIYALSRSSLELRLFGLFAIWIVAGALIAPAASVTTPQWEVLWWPGVGVRYWLIPGLWLLAVVVAAVWWARSLYLRLVAGLLLVVMSLMYLADWRYPPWPDLGWPQHVARFEAAPPGTMVVLPIQPPGWELRLVKGPQ